MNTQETVLMDNTDARAYKNWEDLTEAEVRVAHYDVVLSSLHNATASLNTAANRIEMEEVQYVLDSRADRDDDTVLAPVLVASASDEFAALTLTERVVDEDGLGHLGLMQGSPLMAYVDEAANTFVATFSLHDLRNGLTLDDLTLEYREYAEAFAFAGFPDTREWRWAFESGLSAEDALERLVAEMHDEDDAGCVTMEEILEYQIEQAAGFGVTYFEGEWRV